MRTARTSDEKQRERQEAEYRLRSAGAIILVLGILSGIVAVAYGDLGVGLAVALTSWVSRVAFNAAAEGLGYLRRAEQRELARLTEQPPAAPPPPPAPAR